MVKFSIVVLCLLTLKQFNIDLCYGQVDKLISIKEKLTSKVQVGMSTDEVKAALGRPWKVDSGFPDSDEIIVRDLPNMVGQFNNSTWLYLYPTVTISVEQPSGTTYFINGVKVTEELYTKYKNLSMVYFLEGKVLDPVMAEGYRRVNEPGLKAADKIQDQTFLDHQSKSKWVKRHLAPVLCVIFDRGTKVVATIKVFFWAVLDGSPVN